MKIIFTIAFIGSICFLQLQLVLAQIPTVCTDADSLQNLQCCPTTSDGVCGANANRGQCETLNLPGYSSNTSNVRENWPHYYTRVCQCSGGYGGYDCSRCKIGYFGSDCSQIQVIPRREISTFSPQDWIDFNSILRMTREFDSGYRVIMEESVPGNASIVTTNVTLYGLYVWMHHYATKDSNTSAPGPLIDYAHIAPGFTTWHRYHTLWFEWEIQRMLKMMGRQDYATFRLPYWDWRIEIQNSTGIRSEELFTESRLGATRNVSGFPEVYGSLIGTGWNTLCWLTLGQICDPNINTGPLQRCPFTGTDPCNSNNPDWPTSNDVLEALAFDLYDSPPFNTQSVGSYRSFVDFKVGILTREECNNDRMCMCLPTTSPPCSLNISVTLLANMHSKGHFILGIGDLRSSLTLPERMKGTFEDVAASPNDPMFILHHLMIDCMFEEWMGLHPDGEYPPSSPQSPGHEIDDFMVPFFPLYRQGEMFQSGSAFGISCNLPNVPSHASALTHSIWSLMLLWSILIAIML